MTKYDGVNAMFEEKFFTRKKIIRGKLLDYGFTEETGGYRYIVPLMNGQFDLHILVDEGGVSTKMIDCSLGEEYTLYKAASSAGSFVGAVRTECEAVLADISPKCCEPDIFRGEQTKAIIEYVRDQYGDELEFLWEKFPDNAIWRRRDTGKWYGLILTVPKKKLGLASGEMAEIIDLRTNPQRMAETVDHKKYFPGWHMNKKHWYTMLLDGSVPTEEIAGRIGESYLLAVK